MEWPCGGCDWENSQSCVDIIVLSGRVCCSWTCCSTICRCCSDSDWFCNICCCCCNSFCSSWAIHCFMMIWFVYCSVISVGRAFTTWNIEKSGGWKIDILGPGGHMLGFLGSGITSFGCGNGIGCNGGGLTCWAEAGLSTCSACTACLSVSLNSSIISFHLSATLGSCVIFSTFLSILLGEFDTIGVGWRFFCCCNFSFSCTGYLLVTYCLCVLRKLVCKANSSQNAMCFPPSFLNSSKILSGKGTNGCGLYVSYFPPGAKSFGSIILEFGFVLLM